MRKVATILTTLLIALTLIVGCAVPMLAVNADDPENGEAAGLALAAAAVEPPDDYDKSEVAQNGVYYFNNCSTDGQAGALLITDGTSANGTPYYQTDPNMASDVAFSLDYASSVLSSFCVWQMDIRFDQNGAGFTPKNQSGTKGNLSTCVRRHDSGGKSYLSIQTGSSAFTHLMEINPNTWYQLTLRGYFEQEGAHVDLYAQAYDANGKLVGTPSKFTDVGKRNNRLVRRLVMEKGTSIDNVRVYEVAPARLSVTAAGNVAKVPAKQPATIQYSTSLVTALNEAMAFSADSVTYELYCNGEIAFPDGVTLSDTGLLSLNGEADSQHLTIRAVSKLNPDAYGEAELYLAPLFEIEKVGFNQGYTKLVNFTLNVGYSFDDELAFIAAVYDKDGAMTACYPTRVPGELLTEGEVVVPVNGDLPEGFDPATDTVKIFTWSN